MNRKVCPSTDKNVDSYLISSEEMCC